MDEELLREEVARAADQVVEELLAAADVTAPPVDVIALAGSHLGFVISAGTRRRSRGSPGMPGCRHAGMPASRRAGGPRQVILPPAAGEEERQAAVARAVGVYLKPALLERLGIDLQTWFRSPSWLAGGPRPLMGESLTGLLAARLLVPTHWLAADAPESSHDLFALKRRYRTAAHELIAWRLLDLPAPCIVTVVDDGRVRRRRSNAWPVTKRLEPAEEECRKHVTQHGKPDEVRKYGWTVQGWPAPASGYTRVILRSVVDADALAPF